MDKTYSVLKELWDENYSQWLSVKKENERYVEMFKKSNVVTPMFFLNTDDIHLKRNMELIETIAEKLGYGEYENSFKWKEAR